MNVTPSMNQHHPRSEMRLYDQSAQRLYVNQSERARLFAVAESKPPALKALVLTLLYTGCRLSEALELTTESLQAREGILSIRTLKRRRHHMREIPVPPQLVAALSDQIGHRHHTLLWQSKDGQAINRITAYRWVKAIMREAHIHGQHASPKGLRHGFGIHAVSCGVPLPLVSKWMGHANIKTTAIYTNAVGVEEREMAGRMW